MSHGLPDRRGVLAALAGVGIGSLGLHRALAAQVVGAQPEKPTAGPTTVTAKMVEDAEWVSGITLTDAERKQVAGALTSYLQKRATGLKTATGNAVLPALVFKPDSTTPPPVAKPSAVTLAPREVAKPATPEDLAFLSLADQARLIQSKKISSVELTKLMLARLKKYDPILKCVVSFTEEIALKQATAADAEIAAGKYRGPLHGIPWGAKDLLSYPGTKSTWGAGHYQNQTLDVKAAVAEKLEQAGAVMVAKTTLGSLAMGDVWFGGTTKNPWNIKQGSSGSSAGSACATAAGLVSFGIGTETLGSIVSPSTRCGVTGLRPTFGRVSRFGCMSLSWTLDKIGPLCRSVEDCAIVFAAIHGADSRDPSSIDRPFAWPATKPLSELRVGVLSGTPEEVVTTLKAAGVKPIPIKLPDQASVPMALTILDAESALAFDDITRDGVREGIGTWGGTFRRGRFMTAVDYLRAGQLRTLLMEAMAKLMQTVDVYVGPTYADLGLTNLTGHPCVCLPAGFSTRNKTETPTSVVFTGQLYGEADLLTVAKVYQDATTHHTRRPPEATWVQA